MAASVDIANLMQEDFWYHYRLDQPDQRHLFSFSPDGSIAGFQSPTERRWAVRDDRLELFHESGEVSARLEPVVLPSGEIVLEGPHLLGRDRPIIRLERRGDVPPPGPLRDEFADAITKWGWQVGIFTYGRPHVIGVEYGASLSIGSYCAIGGDVTIVLAQHDASLVSVYPFRQYHEPWPGLPPVAEDHVTGNVRIGSDVWVGNRAVIMAGVTIGDGAVIGANSVVTRDVPPYAVVGGVPARVIRSRFEPRQVERLLRLRWWDWPTPRVNALLPLMMQRDIDLFLETAEARHASA